MDNTKYVPPHLCEGDKTNLEMKKLNKVSVDVVAKNGTLNIGVLKEKRPKTCINVKQLMIQTLMNQT